MEIMCRLCATNVSAQLIQDSAALHWRRRHGNTPPSIVEEVDEEAECRLEELLDQSREAGNSPRTEEQTAAQKPKPITSARKLVIETCASPSTFVESQSKYKQESATLPNPHLRTSSPQLICLSDSENEELPIPISPSSQKSSPLKFSVLSDTKAKKDATDSPSLTESSSPSSTTSSPTSSSTSSTTSSPTSSSTSSPTSSSNDNSVASLLPSPDISSLSTNEHAVELENCSKDDVTKYYELVRSPKNRTVTSSPEDPDLSVSISQSNNGHKSQLINGDYSEGKVGILEEANAANFEDEEISLEELPEPLESGAFLPRTDNLVLKEKKRYLCLLCHRSYNQRNYDHVSTQHFRRPLFACKLCPFLSYLWENDLSQRDHVKRRHQMQPVMWTISTTERFNHIMLYHMDGAVVFKCRHCQHTSPFWTSEFKQLDKHVAFEHPGVGHWKQNVEDRRRLLRPTVTALIDKLFPTSASEISHQPRPSSSASLSTVSSLDRQSYCTLCVNSRRTLPSYKERLRHCAQRHLDGPRLRGFCRVCGRTFSWSTGGFQQKITQHVQIDHPSTTISEPIVDYASYECVAVTLAQLAVKCFGERKAAAFLLYKDPLSLADYEKMDPHEKNYCQRARKEWEKIKPTAHFGDVPRPIIRQNPAVQSLVTQRCFSCNTVAIPRNHVWNHWDEYEKGQPVVTCLICKREFAHYGKLLHHLKSSHGFNDDFQTAIEQGYAGEHMWDHPVLYAIFERIFTRPETEKITRSIWDGTEEEQSARALSLFVKTTYTKLHRGKVHKPPKEPVEMQCRSIWEKMSRKERHRYIALFKEQDIAKLKRNSARAKNMQSNSG